MTELAQIEIERVKKLRRAMKDLEEKAYVLNFYDRSEAINKHCDSLECEVELTLESAIIRLKQLRDNLFVEINDYRTRLLATQFNHQNDSSFNDNLSSIKENMILLDREIQCLDERVFEQNSEHTSSIEEKIQEIQAKIDKFSAQLKSSETALRKQLFNEKFMVFRKNNCFYVEDRHLGRLDILAFDASRPTKQFDLDRALSIVVPISTLKPAAKKIPSLLFLSDHILLSGSQDAIIRAWNYNDGSLLYELHGHTNPVISLELLPNGYLMSASWDKSIIIWDLAEKKRIKTYAEHKYEIISALILPNGNIASYSLDNKIKIWSLDLSRDKSLHTMHGHGVCYSLYPMCMLSNGFLVTSSCNQDRESFVKIWDPFEGRLVRTIEKVSSSMTLGLHVLSNDNLLVSFRDRTMIVIDLGDQENAKIIKTSIHTIRRWVELPNGHLVCEGPAVHNGHSALEIWDPKTGEMVKKIPVKDSIFIFRLSLSKDSKTVAACFTENQIGIWSVNELD